MVVVGHRYPLTSQPDAIEHWSLGLFPTGHIAVCIFFVISGYCVTQSEIHTSSVFSYIMKRTLRIFPGLFFALLFTAFVVGPVVTSLTVADYFLTPQTYYFFDYLKLYPPYHTTLPGVFMQNPYKEANASLWTLAYEFTMYLWVIIAIFLFKSSWRWFILIFSFFFFFFCFFYEKFLGNIFVPFIHLDLFHLVDFGMYFVLGMLAYIYRHSFHFYWWGVLVALLVWMGAYLAATTGYIPLAAIAWVRYFSITYIILYLAFLKGTANKFGNFGDYSYGIYIYAYPIQQSIVALLGKDLPTYQHVFLAFVFILPLSWMSWHYIEKPAIKLKALFH